MGFDPAFRTGCKIAVVDKNGKLLDTTTVYPTEPQNKVEESKKELKALIALFEVSIREDKENFLAAPRFCFVKSLVDVFIFGGVKIGNPLGLKL